MCASQELKAAMQSLGFEAKNQTIYQVRQWWQHEALRSHVCLTARCNAVTADDW